MNIYKSISAAILGKIEQVEVHPDWSVVRKAAWVQFAEFDTPKVDDLFIVHQSSLEAVLAQMKEFPFKNQFAEQVVFDVKTLYLHADTLDSLHDSPRSVPLKDVLTFHPKKGVKIARKPWDAQFMRIQQGPCMTTPLLDGSYRVPYRISFEYNGHIWLDKKDEPVYLTDRRFNIPALTNLLRQMPFVNAEVYTIPPEERWFGFQGVDLTIDLQHPEVREYYTDTARMLWTANPNGANDSGTRDIIIHHLILPVLRQASLENANF